MDIIKVVVGIASFIFTCLLILTFSIKTPEEVKYLETMEALMLDEGLSTSQEVVEQFPQLAVVQSNRKRIAFLKKKIQSLIGGPAPNPSNRERLQIQEYRQEIHQLKEEITRDLSLFASACINRQP